VLTNCNEENGSIPQKIFGEMPKNLSALFFLKYRGLKKALTAIA
jgi:hypothetical protein